MSDMQSRTLRDALTSYFEKNGFGEDGGYEAAWVDFKLGPIPFPFPNTAARKRAVRYHDLHHLVTGYETTFGGELEISAWEIGSGCRGFLAAWQLNLGGLAAGVFSRPKATFLAFLRGRQSDNFYGRDYDALLSIPVSRARKELHVDEPVHSASAADLALFLLAAALGTVVGLVSFIVFAVLAVVALPGLHIAARLARRAQARRYETSRTHSAAT